MEKFKDLPNTPGFRFIGFGYDVNGCRDKGECEVYKNPDGTHSVRGHFDFSHLVGWEHIKTAPEKSRLTSGCSSTLPPRTAPCNQWKDVSCCPGGNSLECGENPCIIHLANYTNNF
jgi:hypothetical protein